jgi:(p)ppGpp synthase/HD superfamily hydrolase
MELSPLFEEALVFAAQLHRSQTRKGSGVPYVAHLLSVCGRVLTHGGNQDQAIAALLHDAAEDQGRKPTLDEIRRHFGPAVANIVADCTDSWVEPKPDWATAEGRRKAMGNGQRPGKRGHRGFIA